MQNRDTRNIGPKILRAAAQILEDRFGAQITFSSATFLSQPDRRNTLIRAILHKPSGILPNSIIIKQALNEKSDPLGEEAWERFSGDWVGLEFLDDLAKSAQAVPQFYGGNTEHRFILLEDLGDVHISLLDALTGTDKNAAEAALQRYATALGVLHGFAHRHVDKYHKIFTKFNHKASVDHDNYESMSPKINAILRKLNIIINPNLTSEISNILKLMKKPGHFTTLIHGDICPDNVFDDPSNHNMRIIDFECSFVRNALLDGVYLRMSMPTCWCTKAFPEDVIEKFELTYRKEIAKNIPAAKEDTLYYESYVAACAYWMLWNLISAGDIWDKDSDLADAKYLNLHTQWRILEDNLQRPRVLYRIESFIETAKKHHSLPELRSIAEQVLVRLKSIWPETKTLGLYPAFG